jgi:hypothetical protein
MLGGVLHDLVELLWTGWQPRSTPPNPETTAERWTPACGVA